MENELTVGELISADLTKAIATLTSQSKDKKIIENYVKEYTNLDRTIRDTQVGKVQLDKTVGVSPNTRIVKSIKSPVNYQKKIVTTSCAFEVGEPVTLSTEPINDLFNELLRVWKSNRIDDKLQKAKTTQKSQTECAIHFFIAPKTGTKATQPAGTNEKIDIKSNVWTWKNGLMSPYFDSNNDMKAFTWQFVTKNAEGKDINNIWIFDETNVYKISNGSGTLALDLTEVHGFDRIPIVYMEQEFPEWYDVEGLIDRYEVALGKLGDSNDYSGHPILLTYGDLNQLPEKNDDGKSINFAIKFKEEAPDKPYHGDAKFLTHDNAPEAVKLEMDTIRELLFSITQTPDISFEKMKSIGAISGTALKLMFLDPMIKAKMNEGQNRTIVERIINILISGITGAVNVTSKAQTNELVVNVKFNSILPSDTLENSTIASNGFSSQSISRLERVKLLDLVTDVEAEVQRLELEFPESAAETTPPVV